MIKIEHEVFPSPEQMIFVIEGMRNPMNSWDNSDSYPAVNCGGCPYNPAVTGMCEPAKHREECSKHECFAIGPNDMNLMKRLRNAGSDHRKFMRMMPVYIRITAPLYWWKEFDTYKVATVANSCSTMHKIQSKEFKLDDFSTEHLSDISLEGFKKLIEYLEVLRTAYLSTKVEDTNAIMTKKDIWWQMIQLLPSSYNQTRNVMLNYEVLANMYKSRINHKLDEWREFCKWMETIPYHELIVSDAK